MTRENAPIPRVAPVHSLHRRHTVVLERQNANSVNTHHMNKKRKVLAWQQKMKAEHRGYSTNQPLDCCLCTSLARAHQRPLVIESKGPSHNDILWILSISRSRRTLISMGLPTEKEFGSESESNGAFTARS